MNKIIKLLQKNARMSIEDIASATNLTVEQAQCELSKLEKDGVILGYTPIINWQHIEAPHVTALVEIKFSLNDSMGFEELSNKIALMKEVDSVHLVSGGYDLSVILAGKTIQEVAFFVNEKLSSMEHVLSTTTHFVLKTYKEHGHLCSDSNKDKREVML